MLGLIEPGDMGLVYTGSTRRSVGSTTIPGVGVKTPGSVCPRLGIERTDTTPISKGQQWCAK